MPDLQVTRCVSPGRAEGAFGDLALLAFRPEPAFLVEVHRTGAVRTTEGGRAAVIDQVAPIRLARSLLKMRKASAARRVPIVVYVHAVRPAQGCTIETACGEWLGAGEGWAVSEGDAAAITCRKCLSALERFKKMRRRRE